MDRLGLIPPILALPDIGGCDRVFSGMGVYWISQQGGADVEVYADLVALLNFAVDFLLLLGTNRLCGYPPGIGRAALAAAVGGLYGMLCILPGFAFLGSTLWRIVSLGLMACISFGWSKSALRRGIVFSLLGMALGGLAVSFGSGSFGTLLLAAAGLGAMCAAGFGGRLSGSSFVPVELAYGGKRLQLSALRDTGNTLRDPVTGSDVLVVSADVAKALTGLEMEQLAHPVETMATGILPGLRLVPYRAVGQSGGMLLALRLQEVKIGTWKGSSLVAFAPEKLSTDGAYQALTGGSV